MYAGGSWQVNPFNIKVVKHKYSCDWRQSEWVVVVGVNTERTLRRDEEAVKVSNT